MRVISGKAKSINLVTPQGMDTRPTTDRVKETLFNILAPDIYSCNFLDLFCGSGAIGIEALSRGAKSTVFIENDKKSIECVKQNLTKTKLMDNARIMPMDVFNALATLESGKDKFDIIFMDPPYNQMLEEKVLKFLSNSKIISNETLIITEASRETRFDYLEELNFEIVKLKEYKNNKHVFITIRSGVF